MPERDDVEQFLEQLRQSLPLPRDERERVVDEFRSHLIDAIASGKRDGLDEGSAAREALMRIGDPRVVARSYHRPKALHEIVIALGALACVGVAGWLLVVAATVVRTLDPTRVGFWSAVAAGFLAYAVLAFGYLIIGARSNLVRRVAAVASAVAVIAGMTLAVPMLLTTGDFEGYIVLMGAVLGGEGVVVIAHLVRRSESRATN
jgi:hypothetical protein